MKECAPLQQTLDSILNRLCALEAAAGVSSPPPPSASTTMTANPDAAPTSSFSSTTTPPSIQAFDTHISTFLNPFLETCHQLNLSSTASDLTTIWHTMKSIIQLASSCTKPPNAPQALQEKALQPIQTAMKSIQTTRLDRKYDWHLKAITEMLASISWLVMESPPAPCNMIKETVGSSDFWSNKIRKEYKSKEGEEAKAHIAFCDLLKKLILDLSAYVKEYHLSGLMWNPRGISMQEYQPPEESAGGGLSNATKTTTSTTKGPSSSSKGGMADLSKELAMKRTGDGNSAATGLRKVSRDQQTWRKEYKKPVENVSPSGVKPSSIKKAQNGGGGGGGFFSKKAGAETKVMPPKCEFKSLGSKWIIEYQTATSNPNGVCTIDVKDVKEQAYIYKCTNATIQINGKLKSIVLDSCTKTNVIFSSAITSCEVVNSKSVQIQSTGICPSFAIDKTDGCLVYLSSEGANTSAFVTSKSTEMNVSWQDEKGEQVERPIPEQFVHKIVKGNVESTVSDIYH